METVNIVERPEEVSYQAIQDLLHRAHESNKAKNLIYATADQTVDKLRQKIETDHGVCFVAMMGKKLVGTATVSFRKLHYWYHNGNVAIIKLVGVDPDYKGQHISSQLVERCLALARERGESVVVSDSAEQNIQIRHLYLNHGFLITDYGLYAANNFYTTIYVNWLDECPYSDFYRSLRYQMKRCWIRLLYKPGKVNRFSGKKG